MPVRDRIIWGQHNPFSDPRLANLPELLRHIRWHSGSPPPGVTGGSIFHNATKDLPEKPFGHYREYDVQPPPGQGDRGKLRIVIGNDQEVYITGNHYFDFRQIINIPL